MEEGDGLAGGILERTAVEGKEREAEKMEWIREEEDGRHVEVEVEEIGRQMERRREKPREEGSKRKEKRRR